MNKRVFFIIVCCSVVLTGAYRADAHRDRGSWKKTLNQKAVFFETNAKQRHNIEGSYPSSVHLIPPKHYAGSQEGAWKKIVETGELPPGWVVDHGTTGFSNVAHTSCWTACYLTTEAFRVAFLRKKYGSNSPQYRQAYERADELIGSLRILTLISGVPGYLARGMAYGHGISYEERFGVGTRDLWAQGVGEYAHLRYRGGPSHHNYDHVFRGLGIYYFVAADDRQKKAIRSIVEDMSNWAHLENDMVVMHTDGKRVSTVLIGGWGGLGGDDRPSGGSLMATTGLKVASVITGNTKVKALYDKWVDRLGYRDPERTKRSIMGPPRSNYDDTDHLLADLYLLNLIEKDPDLRKFYRECVRDSWRVHKEDKMAWFNYLYRALLGEQYGDPEGSLWNLRSFPTCRIFQPQMNSIRTDLQFYTEAGVRESLHPLPVYERPSDNEYAWKMSPYSLDGWLSRIVSVLEVSPHDPYVQLAADTSGQAYWSNTRGEVWHSVPALPQVYGFLFSTSYQWIVFAATQGGIYRSLDEGANWSKVSSEPTYRLYFDFENDHVLYAVTQGAIYKSEALGERMMGTRWRSVSGAETAGTARLLDVDTRGPGATLYRLSSEGLYRKGEEDVEWRAPPLPVRTHGFGDFKPLGGEPQWLRVTTGKKKRIFCSVEFSGWDQKFPFVSFSEDEGRTWKPVLRQLEPVVGWRKSAGETLRITDDDLRKAFGFIRQFLIQDLWVDKKDPDTWYGLMETGVAVTHDAGRTWTASRDGLDIPRVHAMWIPCHAPDVYVGTPAGLYVSRDRAASWQDTPLIPQGVGAHRAEIGGIGYLAAYWMGRYHGFITDKEDTARWWEQ